MILSISTVPPAPEYTGSEQAHGEELLAKARDITQLALSALEGIKTGGEVAKLSEAAESSIKILDPDPDNRGERHISLFLSRTGDELFNRVVAYLLKPDKSGWSYIDPDTERNSDKWGEIHKSVHTRLAAQMPLDEFTNFLTCVRDQIEKEISQEITKTGLPKIVSELFEKLKEIKQGDLRLSTLLSNYADEKYKWQQQGLATIEPVLNLIQRLLTESRSATDRKAVAEPSQPYAQKPLGLIAESSLIVGFPGNASIVMTKTGVDQVDGAGDPLVNASTLSWRGQADSWQEELVVPTLVTAQTEDSNSADDQKKGTAADETTSEVVGNGGSDNQATVVVADMAGQNPVEARSDGREDRQPGEPVGKPETQRATAFREDVEEAVAFLNEYAPLIVRENVKWLLKRERIAVSPEMFRDRWNKFITGPYDEESKSNLTPRSTDIEKLKPHFWYEMAFVTDNEWPKRLFKALKDLGYGQPTAVESTSDGHASIDNLVQTKEGRVRGALEKLYPNLIDGKQSGLEIKDVVEAICFFNDYPRGTTPQALQNVKLDRQGGKLKAVIALLKSKELVESYNGGRIVKLAERLPDLLQAALYPHAEPGKFLLALSEHPSADASLEYAFMAS